MEVYGAMRISSHINTSHGIERKICTHVKYYLLLLEALLQQSQGVLRLQQPALLLLQGAALLLVLGAWGVRVRVGVRVG